MLVGAGTTVGSAVAAIVVVVCAAGALVRLGTGEEEGDALLFMRV
jgi:hypothetical protein